MIDVEIGPRLLAARREAGLTVRALAADIGVSGALISQIETGRTQPSVNTLYALVNRLGISLDWLIGISPEEVAPAPSTPDGTAPSPALRKADTHPVLQIANGVRWELVSSENDGAVEAVLVTYEPGGDSSVDGTLTRHEGVESAFLISGVLTVQLDDEEFEVTAGDSLTFDSLRPHRYINRSSENAQGLWLSTGRFHLS